jgi:hypothetical protein
MILTDAKTALARKLDINFADIANNDLFTDADLVDCVQAGANKAWDFKPWAMTEGDWKTVSTSDGYNDYPSDCEEESIDVLYIAGYEYRKLNFADYEKFLADNPTATDRIWSEHKRFYFYNVNADTVGSEIWFKGKKRAPTLSTGTDLLPFSPTTDNQENSGNRAIVNLAYAEALASEKLKQYAQADVEEKKAFAILATLWAPIGARRSVEQSQDRPIFDVPDFFGGRPNSRNTNIGNFP